MKFAIVILLFLATMSHIDADADNENMLETADEFVKGVMELPVPDKLARGVLTHGFIEIIAKSTQEMIIQFILEYHRQATKARETMIRDMDSAIEDLTATFTDKDTIQNSLNRVNNILGRLMSTIPGNVQIKRRGLPELPERRGEIVTHWGNEELSGIFVDLASLVDRDLASIHSLIDGIYLAGWEKARWKLNELQNQFREFDLNYLLKSIANKLPDIDKNEDKIKINVHNDTWETYKRLNASVSNAYESIKNQ